VTKTQQPLLIVENLVKHFPITKGMLLTRKTGAVRAVDGISFTIMPGETLGLVGESGSGKSTTGRLILRLLEVDAGKILFDGTDVRALAKDELRELRKDIQIIFQDPYASLNPRMKVGEIVAEPLRIHKLVSGRELEREVIKLLDVVGLAAVYAKRYPHELSGGAAAAGRHCPGLGITAETGCL
jgi:oligopeptide transport system ATP-binding protein